MLEVLPAVILLRKTLSHATRQLLLPVCCRLVGEQLIDEALDFIFFSRSVAMLGSEDSVSSVRISHC